jgi:hypothetical protein
MNDPRIVLDPKTVRVRDDMDDETWHRIRDQEERERRGQNASF